MDISRVVQTWCASSDDPEGGGRAGTGYLVSSELVLTAQHCVNLPDPVIEVQRPSPDGSAPWYRATVLAAGNTDIALLLIDDARWAPGRIRKVRWGRIDVSPRASGTVSPAGPWVSRTRSEPRARCATRKRSTAPSRP
ncbi:trypsin-like peptidase domain-containing protein [Streptomyces sp. NPDC016845]|uniref:trypsin-like peptidase domain-containing protein n=1 Tax=Streptomyces sp. NPDC016845 TaxID=3364972 RepID=UPI00378E8826